MLDFQEILGSRKHAEELLTLQEVVGAVLVGLKLEKLSDEQMVCVLDLTTKTIDQQDGLIN